MVAHGDVGAAMRDDQHRPVLLERAVDAAQRPDEKVRVRLGAVRRAAGLPFRIPRGLELALADAEAALRQIVYYDERQAEGLVDDLGRHARAALRTAADRRDPGAV